MDLTAVLTVKFDQMLQLLKDLKERPKFSTSIKLITTKSKHAQKLLPTIQLDIQKNYKAALTSFSTYNSLKNIYASRNDTFKYSKDAGKTWKIIKLQPGCYEINSINKEIIRQTGIDKKQLNFNIETTVNRISLTLDENHQVDFSVENSLSTLLGFDKKIYTKGFHVGSNLPKITDINSIVVHCNIVQGAYLNGESTNALYSFPSYSVPIGYKIVKEPRVLTYFPITQTSIDTISVWFTDENNNLIEFSGEEIIVDILIQES